MRQITVAAFLSFISIVSAAVVGVNYKVNGNNIEIICQGESFDPEDTLCFDLRICHRGTGDDICPETVAFAVFEDNKMHLKGLGVAVGKRHVITTVSSGAYKYHNDQEWVVIYLKDYREFAYTLMSPKHYPLIAIGRFNLSAWQDITLFKLPDAADSFPFSLPIQRTDIHTTDGNHHFHGFLSAENKKEDRFASFKTKLSAECSKLFKHEEPDFSFDPTYMYCAEDEFYTSTNKLGAEFSVGSEITENQGGKRWLTGLKSIYGYGSSDKHFIIVKLGLHCDWIERVSNGEVKCEH